ncbi:MAG: hypothetical protein ABWZ78_17365 [Burkholderiaceae bacterium]
MQPTRLLDVERHEARAVAAIGAALAAVGGCGLILGRSHRLREAGGVAIRANAAERVGYRD